MTRERSSEGKTMRTYNIWAGVPCAIAIVVFAALGKWWIVAGAVAVIPFVILFNRLVTPAATRRDGRYRRPHDG